MALQKDISFGKLNFALGFNRTNAFPLDANSYFEDYAEAVAAAQTAAAVGSSDSAFYIGQIIIINDTKASTDDYTNQGIGLYQITGTAGNGTLTKFGQAASAEELTAEFEKLKGRVTVIEGKLVLATNDRDGLLSKEDKAKLDTLTATKIDKIQLNGTELTPVDKTVNLALDDTYAKKDTVNDLSTELNNLKDSVKNGMRYVGESTTDPLGAGGATVADYTSFKNGDICFYDDKTTGSKKEYIYNAKTSTWRELGDEGLHATTQYVDSSVKKAKEDLTAEIGKVSSAVQTEQNRAMQAEQDLQTAINGKADSSTVTEISGKVDTLVEKVGSAKEGSTEATGLFKLIADEAKARADADTATNGVLTTLKTTVENQGTLISNLRDDVGGSSDSSDADTLFGKIAKLREEVGTADTKGPLFERIANLETKVEGLPPAFITGLKDGETNLKVEDGKLSLDKVNTDLLYNGNLELVLDGGAATK